MSDFNINDNNNELENLQDNEADKDNNIVEEATGEGLDIVEASPKKQKYNFTKDIVDYIEIFSFALCFVILIFSFFCRLCTVAGPSMEDTLIDGEKVIISDMFYSPKRNDIIVFHDTDTLNKPVVKRVIATEGDTVKITYSIDKMTVEITDKNGNTETLAEDYIRYNFSEKPYIYENCVYTVPDGMIFVMGDNRCHSTDSRDPNIGFVDEREVLGRVIFRITPLSKFGTVK